MHGHVLGVERNSVSIDISTPHLVTVTSWLSVLRDDPMTLQLKSSLACDLDHYVVILKQPRRLIRGSWHKELPCQG